MLPAIDHLKQSLPSLSSFGLGAINLSGLGFGGRGVGLDIGEERVRAALLKRKGQQLTLAGVGVSEIAYAGNEGAIQWPVLLGGLRWLLKPLSYLPFPWIGCWMRMQSSSHLTLDT